MSKSKPKSLAKKPLRAAAAEISAPEITVKATYTSAIGIDVHLNLLVCTAQVQLDNHQELTESRDFYTNRDDLDKFAAWCKSKNPQIILMESTGSLWYSVYEALEDVGFTDKELVLINARDAKAACGRKTDRKDASRLASLARSGNFRKSFVPIRPFRLQRFISREIQKNTQEMARVSNRIQKMLCATGCRASTVFSNVHGKAASVILDAKLRNAPDLALVIQNNCKRLRCSAEEIYSALNFNIEPQIANQLLAAKQKLLWLQEYDDESFERLRELQQPYDHYVKLLMSIPGIKERAARLLFAELCPNLEEHFLDSEHFCSWLGICPGDNTSAGKQKRGKCPKGNKWFRRCLIQCAQALAVSKRAPYYERFMALKLRRGRKRAIVALAHFLSRVIYSILTSRKAFTSRETSVFRDVVVQRVKQSIRQLKKMSGVSVINDLIVENDSGAILGRISLA